MGRGSGRPVTRMVVRRVVLLLVQLTVIVSLTFVGLRVLPVDPVDQFVGQLATPDVRRITTAHLGLNRPILSQLGHYLSGLPTLNLGRSWVTNDSIRSELATRIPVTLQLIVLGFLVTIALAIPLGLLAAAKPRTRLGKAVSGYALFAGSQPDFWWGLVFILLLVVRLHWLPVPLGVLSPGEVGPAGPTRFILVDSLLAGKFGIFASALDHYALPVMTLAFVQTGAILKIMRQSASDILSSGYVLHARATGATTRAIRRTVLQNA